jgi:hypothetical protein
MTDLRGALLAAAEEADKMQKETNCRLNNIESYIQYIEGENERLKKKLKDAAEVIKQFVDILSED